MVSKTSASETPKVSKTVTAKKAPAKKVVAKKVVAKKSVAKAKSTPILDTQVPVKADINPVEQVLEIKAHNEEKKAIKTTAKAVRKATKAVKSAPVSEEKGNKAVPHREAAISVKNTAQQVAAKKFATLKNEPEAKKACNCGCKDGMLAAWARAYKNMFNFKGRTSRYELWAFSLFNLLFAIVFYNLLIFVCSKMSLNWAETTFNFVFSLFFVAQFVTITALTVRRIHDVGYTAWKGFFFPLIISSIVIVVLLAAISAYIHNVQSSGIIVECAYYLLAFAFLTALFYFTKIILVSQFYDAEPVDNKYGKLRYNELCYKNKGLRYTVWFYIISYMLYIVWYSAVLSLVRYM